MLPQSELIKTLGNVVKGDKIAIRDGDPYYAYDGYRLATVERTTKTLIIAGGTKYRRDDGREAGYDWRYRQGYSHIVTIRENGIDRLMTPDECQAIIDKKEDAYKRHTLATIIRQGEPTIKNLPLETLKQAALLLRVVTQEQIDKM